MNATPAQLSKLTDYQTEPSSDATLQSLLKSIGNAHGGETPYQHWLVAECFPEQDVTEVLSLPFKVPELGGVSGTREVHNASRSYFDVKSCQDHAVCDRIATAMQSKNFTDSLSKTFDVNLSNTYLRIEYTQDAEGFWLEPHTDIGVKVFTMLIYMSTDPAHHNLGTDIYDSDKKHLGSAPFVSNTAFIFVPSDITYHGFEEREITGVRKSLIVNFVTDEWRAVNSFLFLMPQSDKDVYRFHLIESKMHLN